MEPQITTQPLPPLGTTTTPTPLSIEGTLTNNMIEGNLATQPIPSLNNKNSLYYGKFTIDDINDIGTKVFEYDAEYPMGASNNSYYSQPGNDGLFIFLCPWSLINVWFSRQCKIDFALVFQPVKVSDSRVSLDTLIRYKGESVTTYNIGAFANDTYSHYIDDNDGQFSLMVPAYWNTNFVPTRSVRMLQRNIQPDFIPKTKMTTFIRSPYVPTLMHPNKFDVLVYLIPMVSVASTMVGATRVVRTSPNTDNYLPLPYVFNRELI